MNRKESKKLSEFPKGLDSALNAKYPGIEAESVFDFFGSMNYVTHYRKDTEHSNSEIECFIQGFLAGNRELANRLLSKD